MEFLGNRRWRSIPADQDAPSPATPQQPRTYTTTLQTFASILRRDISHPIEFSFFHTSQIYSPMLKDLRGFKLNLAIALSGACAWILQGYDQAVMNGLLTMTLFQEQFPVLNSNRPGVNQAHASLIKGTIVSIYELGCAAGCGSCFFVGDKFGRKKMIMAFAVLTMVGVIIQVSSFKIEQLAIGRIVTGCGVGGFTATVPMWISECSSAKLRGKLVAVCGAMAISGVCLASWVDFGFYFVKHSAINWRMPIAIQVIFPIICFCLVSQLPDSPRWLVKQGRVNEAAEIFARLEDTTVDSEHVQAELATIEQALMENPKATSASPFAFTKNKHFRRTVMAVGLNIGAQMTGVNVVTFYSTTIFQKQLGYSAIEARIFSGCLQIFQTMAAFFGIVLIDILGRRGVMIHSSALMAVAQFVLGGLASNMKNPSNGKAMIAFFFLALYAFPTGLLMAVFMYAAEIAPLEIRAKITAMSAAANWLFNFLVAMASLVAFDTIGYKYYFLYASCATALCISVILFFPETKGRTLEEIDDVFIVSKSPFDTVSVAKKIAVMGDDSENVTTLDWKAKPEAEFVENNKERESI